MFIPRGDSFHGGGRGCNFEMGAYIHPENTVPDKVFLHVRKCMYSSLVDVLVNENNAQPMMQVLRVYVIRCLKVELYCGTKGLSIVGYYHANQLLSDTSVSDTAQAIASKLAQYCDKACLLLVSEFVSYHSGVFN